MAQHFLNDYGFDSRLELEVWKLHSEGIVPAMISKIIKPMGIKANKDTIYKVIQRLERAMKSGLFFGE